MQGNCFINIFVTKKYLFSHVLNSVGSRFHNFVPPKDENVWTLESGNFKMNLFFCDKLFKISMLYDILKGP